LFATLQVLIAKALTFSICFNHSALLVSFTFYFSGCPITWHCWRHSYYVWRTRETLWSWGHR